MAITLEGTTTADGRLIFDEPLQLPPGRYQVTLTPIPDEPDDSTQPKDRREEFWSRIRELRAKYLSKTPPDVGEKLLRDLEAQREEWAERDAEIERLQRESDHRRRAERESAGDGSPTR